jgi:hypothetical protein
MIWIFVLVAAVLASEAFLRLPLLPVIRRVAETARKSGRVLASKRISDHWKERALPRYSWIIGSGSVHFFGPLMRPAVIAALCLVSIAYVWLRLRVIRG